MQSFLGRHWFQKLVLNAGLGAAPSPARCAELIGIVARMAYIGVFCFVLLSVLAARRGPRRTSQPLAVVLVLRGLAAALRAATGSRCSAVCDGLFLSAVAVDLLLGRMAGRDLHPVLALMATMVLAPGMELLTLALVVAYYFWVFRELQQGLNLPLLRVCRNVYCDGIYDLCHVGHKNVFRRAIKLGDRLYVGVVGDVDANNYKRPPIMSAKEREVEVAGCKGVTGVIPNAPCFGLTEDFLQEHHIHVVAFGEEYLERYPNPDDDPYYKVPRKLGIAVPLPRTQGLSTSDLIQRILDRGSTEKKSPT